MSAGCWTGEDSRGLPCESNVECGIGLACVDGYCGGVAAESLCGNGWLDPGEDCDEGELNANDGACRPDCTPETCGDGVQGPTELCDLGQQNTNDGACRPDCTPETCGDGIQGPTEACDDGNTTPNDGCSSTCTNESCGNGIVDAGEDCDEGGMDTATCDSDCSSVVCGDTHVNAAAGESCDNDDPATDDRECMANCTVPLLWDDMEPTSPVVPWTHEKLSGDDMFVQDTWTISNRNPVGMRSWDSGLPPYGGADPILQPATGETRLMTPPLDLGGLEGQTIRLRFEHARKFTDCMENTSFEGALVEVSVDGGPYQTIVPALQYSGMIGSGNSCINPLDGQQGFTLDVDPHIAEVFDLSAYAGSTIKIGFHIGWDCTNCIESDQTGRGWFIDNVIVAIE